MTKMYLLDLHQFDAGDAAGADGTAAQAEAGNVATQPGEGQPATDESEAEEDLEAEFESLISGKYKEQFQARTQRAIGKRMSAMQTDLQKALTENRKLSSKLSARYGLQNASTEQLVEAIDKDDAWLEDAAMKEGLSVDQYRKIADMRDRLAEAESAREEADRERFRREFQEKIDRQAADCKAQFPDFDFEREYNSNETFRNQMKMGADVVSAYKFAHMDDLIASGMAMAAQKGAERTAAAVRNNLQRPQEAGARKVAAATVGTDWSSMSSEDFRAYQEKLLAGG